MISSEKQKTDRHKGSITAEASIALSLFLLFFLMMIFFYLLLNLEMRIQNAIENAADFQMLYAMIKNEETNPETHSNSNPILSAVPGSCRLDTVFLKQYVAAELGVSYLDSCWIRGGSSGLDFRKSRFMEDGEKIQVIVSYSIRIPFWGLRDIQIIQSAERRVWIGADSRNADRNTGDTVYLTEEGSVYHLYEDCSYINIKLEAVSFQDLNKLRNADGHIYYACQSCKPESSGIVYISRYGEHYHASKSCKAIKKNYSAVSLEAAGNRKLCSKCAQRAGK